MVGVLAFPVLFFALIMPAFGLDARWAFVAPVLLAASIGWGRHNDVALDSTALWLDVVSGQLGREIMWGRMAAIVTWALPVVLVAAVGTLAWTGLWSLAPAVVGACLGVLGLTLGISALTSVLLPYRAPAPGENPFGAEVGSVGASLVAQLISSAATGLALPLVTFAFALALVVDPAWGWLALVTGLVLGPGSLAWAVSYAGRQYDRRAGMLVASVS
jgi:ABC-2 type transport system permease protein